MNSAIVWYECLRGASVTGKRRQMKQSVHVLRVGRGVKHAQISAVGMSLLIVTWREERIIEEGFLREYRSEA